MNKSCLVDHRALCIERFLVLTHTNRFIMPGTCSCFFSVCRMGAWGGGEDGWALPEVVSEQGLNGSNPLYRTHFLCSECPLTFPELLFIWGLVRCERSLFKPQYLWMAWDKDSGHVLGSHAISTGRKQGVELPESQTANPPEREGSVGQPPRWPQPLLPSHLSAWVPGRRKTFALGLHSSKEDSEIA